ncbi:Anthocyanidin 5,3-O-glucosyltransferase [Acorus calamus]|uniref:Anthocyanidin 5,3-O-glucosyltransferase n=1 Tax=Acorus calamus TaxID=4465 RepID=A0AAV9FNN5_ACOCL|nr:Anthocyanidin 5,3-O-glucosyltransferase [Acorus calamus]
MVELGKLFVHHGFNVTILLIPPPHPFIASVSASNPSITFRHLPMIDLSPDSVPSEYHEPYQLELIRLHTLNLAHALRSIITEGIILNSDESLEPRSLKAISDGLCMPNAAPPVPVHCIGPLIMSEGRGGGDDCLKWLDAQPEKSVVFLCFGSLGLLSAEQLREIAVGLDRSGHRFLWVNRLVSATPEPDLDTLLPPGFLERTKDRGLVLKSWAPQAAVLSHGSVGGFVTHCGWNSVLEAVCGGVPMVAWPLYAEQRLNRVFLVEELKLAIPIDDGLDKGVVSAAEVERRVRELMSDDDDGLRERVLRAKYESVKAMREGGSSDSVLIELVNAWKK